MEASSAFTVAFAPERAQYCVERVDGMRIWPMPQAWSDPDAAKRAVKLAEVLNRMEREPREPTPDIPPDYCHACDLAVYAVASMHDGEDRDGVRLLCPECGAQVAEGTVI